MSPFRVIEPDEVRKALALVRRPLSVIEIRALDAQLNGQRYSGTVYGYFDSDDACVDAVSNVQSAAGIYITMNPVNRQLLARAVNRLKYARKGDPLTVDHDILRRHCFLIDIDAERSPGISATDEEKAKAMEKARQIYKFLKERGWTEPIVADSGNGYHLLYRIDLPVDDERLCEKTLAALADRFKGDGAKLDRSVHNPARIMRLYGTRACKGDSTKERPHRMSQIIATPS
jgi:hypothetical protein